MASPLVDLLLAIASVLAATGFLVWHLGFRKAAPACHPSRVAKRARGGAPAGADVVVGAGLARGLARAQARRAQK